MPPSIEVRCLLHQLAAHGKRSSRRLRGKQRLQPPVRCIHRAKPAAALNSTPASFSAAQAAMEWVKIAIWLFSVRESVSLVALKAQQLHQTGAFACFLKNQLGSLRVLIKILAHAGGLCALTREKCKTVVHVSFLKIIIKR